jgi:hypothetical protein
MCIYFVIWVGTRTWVYVYMNARCSWTYMYMVVWEHIFVNVYTCVRAFVTRIYFGIFGVDIRRSRCGACSPTSGPRAGGTRFERRMCIYIVMWVGTRTCVYVYMTARCSWTYMYMVVWEHIFVNVYTRGSAFVTRIYFGIFGVDIRRSRCGACSPTPGPRAGGHFSNSHHTYHNSRVTRVPARC